MPKTPATTDQAASTPQSGYCMKCRKSQEMKNPKAVTMQNGRPATKGTCPACNTGMFRIGKSTGGK